MSDPNFKQIWPRCFVGFVATIEMLATVILVLTELGNIAANFWTANVFAGFWCALVMIFHFIGLYVTACCSPSSSAATRAFVITIISLLATALLISFDAVFIALPSTCILTSSCVSNSAQTSGWSYTLSSSFLTTFKTLSPFTNYTSTSAKYLFQTIQLGVGCLCFVLSVIYVILYLIYKSKAKKSIYPQTQPPAMYQQQQQFNPNFNPQGIRRGPPPRNPQAYPGEIEWS